MRSSYFGSTVGGLVLLGSLAACGGGGGDGGAPVVAPTLSTQPQNQSVQTSGTASFSVTATGSGLSYQWKRNGTVIAGAMAATYTTPAATYLDSGAQYTVDVTNTGGSVTSTAGRLTLVLSADQQAYEALNVAPGTGSQTLSWNLNFSGAEATGTNYAYSSAANTITSPLTNGPQANQQSSPQNMTSTLALPASSPMRVLKGGSILVVPDRQGGNAISYVGGGVAVGTLAADGTTVAYSQIRSSFSLVPLTGTMAATPLEFAHPLNSFFANPLILNAGATYSAGAAYLKYTATASGDRYEVFDCHATTVDANVSPCSTTTSLTNLLTAGFASDSDGVTYHLGDGAMTTVAGVPVWIATAPRPLSSVMSSTVEYRIYFQLDGNVYTGSFVKDGTVFGGGYYVSNPAAGGGVAGLTFLPYQIRINKAARDSLTAAMQI